MARIAFSKAQFKQRIASHLFVPIYVWIVHKVGLACIALIKVRARRAEVNPRARNPDSVTPANAQCHHGAPKTSLGADLTHKGIKRLNVLRFHG